MLGLHHPEDPHRAFLNTTLVGRPYTRASPVQAGELTMTARIRSQKSAEPGHQAGLGNPKGG